RRRRPARGRLGHGQLQGEPAPAHAARPARGDHGGRVRRAALPGARGEHRAPDPRPPQPAAPPERERQLRQGRPARAREDRAGEGPGPRARAPPRHVGRAHRPHPMSGGPVRVVNPWIVAVAVMFATFMEILDTTVVNVSLPHIAGSLSATIDESTWALTSYLVANAIVLPLTGWLANHFGRKRLLMLSVGGFT